MIKELTLTSILLSSALLLQNPAQSNTLNEQINQSQSVNCKTLKQTLDTNLIQINTQTTKRNNLHNKYETTLTNLENTNDKWNKLISTLTKQNNLLNSYSGPADSTQATIYASLKKTTALTFLESLKFKKKRDNLQDLINIEEYEYIESELELDDMEHTYEILNKTHLLNCK